MSQRLNHFQNTPELIKKISDFSMTVAKSSIGKTIMNLIDIRASQLNG